MAFFQEKEMITIKAGTKTIAKQAEVCTTMFSQARGMMFRLTPKALIFVFKKPRYVSLHNIFVFRPLDVLLLDINKQIVEIKQHFTPFSVYFPYTKPAYIIETPSGVVKKYKLKKGDKLSFRITKYK